jgi:hypothetical protein
MAETLPLLKPLDRCTACRPDNSILQYISVKRSKRQNYPRAIMHIDITKELYKIAATRKLPYTQLAIASENKEKHNPPKIFTSTPVNLLCFSSISISFQ